MNTLTKAYIIVAFFLLLGCISVLHGAEVVTRFELTSTLTVGEVELAKWKTFDLGKHVFLASDDGSIKRELEGLVGKKVRIIVYEVQ